MGDQSVNGYVFAGGKSSRMGRDKAHLQLAGATLAQRAVDKLALVAGEVHLCGWNSATQPPAPILPDAVEDAGPLAALVPALEHAGGLAAVLAVDLPLIPWQLLEWLIQRAQLTGAWATVPVVEDRPQPLCAVYSAQLAPRLRELLMSGERKLMRALETACPAEKLDRFVLSDILPEKRRSALPVWFMNVNTPEDLAAAEQAYRNPHVW
jgi:molybdopterin-guanine dinucleotide biosynthesis protein A